MLYFYYEYAILPMVVLLRKIEKWKKKMQQFSLEDDQLQTKNQALHWHITSSSTGILKKYGIYNVDKSWINNITGNFCISNVISQWQSWEMMMFSMTIDYKCSKINMYIFSLLLKLCDFFPLVREIYHLFTLCERNNRSSIVTNEKTYWYLNVNRR